MLKRATRQGAACLRAVPVAAAVGRQGHSPTGGTGCAPRDRLTLDHYLDMETVSDPQLSPDGTQIIYTRGWVDKMNDKRESSLWIMNADGSRNRFLVRAATRAGRRPAIASPTPRRASRRARRSSSATWTPKARSRRSRTSRSAGGRRVVARRQVLAFTMNVEDKNDVADQDAEARPKAPSGPRRRASSSGSTTGRIGTGLRSTTATATSSSCRPTAARRGSSRTATGITPASSGRPTASRSSSASLRVRERRVPVARVGDLRGQRRHRRDHAAHDSARGPTATRSLARRQARRLHRLRLVDATRGQTASST